MTVRDSKAVVVYRALGICAWLPVAYRHSSHSPEYLADNAILTPLFFCYLAFVVGSSLASLFSTSVTRHLGTCFLVGLLSLTLYNAVELYEWSLGLRQATVSVVTIGLMCFVFHSARLVLIYASTSVVMTLAAAVLIPNPEAPVLRFALQLIAVALIPALISVTMLRNRAALRESNAVQEAIFTQSPDALFYGNPRSPSSASLSQRTVELFETDDARVVASLIEAAFAKAYGADKDRMLAKAFLGAAWQGSLEFASANGTRFFGSLAISHLDKSVDTVIVRISDISEMQQKQRELESARDAAEAATEIRARFLANMSHEIRTPMNGVIGMTSLLLNTQTTEEQFGYIETIRSSGESLLSIINEILDFSKIEAGHVTLETQSFSLEQCVAEALDIVAPIAHEKDLELILDLRPQDLVQVEGDVQRIRQVLVNLLSNAIKFTPSGEVSLKVRAQVGGGGGEKSGLTVHFEVRDTGIGIPASKLSSLFDAFTQADESTTRRFGGTGLGLSISKSLAQLMGGDVAVQSVEGNGSAFSFWVVLEATAKLTSTPPVSLRDCRLCALVFNDACRNVLTELLRSAGLKARAFSTAEEMLAALPGEKPELIVVDSRTPQADANRIREQVQRECAPVPPVVLIASAKQQPANRAEFAAVLRKPVRPGELFRALAASLAGEPFTSLRSVAAELDGVDLRVEALLLVEDNAVNQAVARQMLKKLGIVADTAGNGLEAVEMVRHGRYSVVLMDVQMPEMDGLEATRRIRKMSDVLQPHIIAMTANVMQEDRRRCMSAGMDDFVPKPVQIQDVREALVRASFRGPASASNDGQAASKC